MEGIPAVQQRAATDEERAAVNGADQVSFDVSGSEVDDEDDG